MDANTLLQEWRLITSLLPQGWRELARQTGALQRGRKVRDPEILLLLIMLHVAGGLSLRQAVARATRTGIAHLSDVGLLKRLRNAGPWLQAMAAALYAESPFRRGLDEAPKGRRLRVVDATTVREPGSTGTNWRIHYCVQLPLLACDFFEITGPSGGETYTRVPVQRGDVVLGDRGYSHREGAAHVIDQQGDVVVRLNARLLPLLAPDGAPFDLISHVRGLVEYQPGEWPVRFEARGRLYAARLCAVRKSAAATERARIRLQQEARKKQKVLSPRALELAEYIVVLTSLTGEFSTAQVLELYRARWQIELAFKRFKSLLGAGHVPKYDPDSARAWLHAKILAVLLMQRLGEEARLFSPWGFELPTSQPVEGVHRGS